MCGICGIVRPMASRRQVSVGDLIRMRDVMTHRGPDGSGLFNEGRAGLAHRRLAIIDVKSGQQPMHDESGSLHIVYNGEIYNHLDLRAGLERRGHRYRTRCDTETVLRLYQEEGATAVERLRGMFAFAIWDSRKQELFLARDRLGVKPLYYAHAPDGSLYFASEIKALLEARAVAPELNYEALPDYLANHATSGAATLFAGVQRLLPGHTLRWRDGAVDIRQYWDLSFTRGSSEHTSDRELIREFGERFSAAVRMRLMSDVPLGYFFSGGSNSTTIWEIHRVIYVNLIITFSVAFAERDAYELAYALLVADVYLTEY